jgi:phosphoglycolate phosphatase-like HAD superfamily hydrolase
MEHRNPIIVGFDLDGVIIDHTQNKLTFAHRVGVDLQPSQTHAEVMGQYMTPDQYSELKWQIYDHSPEALEAPLMEGAYYALKRLKEADVPIVLVSLQKNPMHAVDLLDRHGLWGSIFTADNTFFAKDKEEKHRIARALLVTHFVDDEPGVLDSMVSIPERILFDTRALFPHHPGVTVVSGWDSLLRALSVS